MKPLLMSLLILTSLPNLARAKSQLFLGAYKALKDTQNSNGKTAGKPFSPAIAVGHNIQVFDTRFGFSPQLGYIHTQVTAKDSYGKQKIHSFFLHWDFLYNPEMFPDLAFRFGVGNFIKRTSGKGGTVEIPNGTGTDQARRPGKTTTSYTSTLNLGMDYNFSIPSNEWFNNGGLRAELFTFRPLSKENRKYSFMLGLLLYF